MAGRGSGQSWITDADMLDPVSILNIGIGFEADDAVGSRDRQCGNS